MILYLHLLVQNLPRSHLCFNVSTIYLVSLIFPHVVIPDCHGNRLNLALSNQCRKSSGKHHFARWFSGVLTTCFVLCISSSLGLSDFVNTGVTKVRSKHGLLKKCFVLHRHHWTQVYKVVYNFKFIIVGHQLLSRWVNSVSTHSSKYFHLIQPFCFLCNLKINNPWTSLPMN